MKNTLFLTLFLSIFLTTSLSGQSKLYLSEDWSGLGGDLTTFHHNSSATDIYSNVYVVGSTMNEVNFNHDILLQKFDRSGNLIWEQTYNGLGNGDDMGIEIYIDDSQNVYITGSTYQSATNDLDLVVQKYTSSGTLSWTYTYNNGGLPNPYDVGTAITGESGAVYVTGSSFDASSLSDYITIKLT